MPAAALVMRLLAFAALFALVPGIAQADRKELYVALGLEPALMHTNDAYDTRASGNTTRGALALTAYYGLTNTLHVGAALRSTMAKDIHVSPIAVQLPDGTRPTGTLYEDLFAVSLGAVAHYRVDTGYRTAPTLSLEAGLASYSYTNRIHSPNNAGYAFTVRSTSDTAPYVRPAVGVEYRATDRVVVAVSVAAELAPGVHQPWAIGIPFNVGLIW